MGRDEEPDEVVYETSTERVVEREAPDESLFYPDWVSRLGREFRFRRREIVSRSGERTHFRLIYRTEDDSEERPAGSSISAGKGTAGVPQFVLVFRDELGERSELRDKTDGEPRVGGQVLVDGSTITVRGVEWLVRREDLEDGRVRFVCLLASEVVQRGVAASRRAEAGLQRSIEGSERADGRAARGEAGRERSRAARRRLHATGLRAGASALRPDSQGVADERDRLADERELIADERGKIADERDGLPTSATKLPTDVSLGRPARPGRRRTRRFSGSQ